MLVYLYDLGNTSVIPDEIKEKQDEYAQILSNGKHRTTTLRFDPYDCGNLYDIMYVRIKDYVQFESNSGQSLALQLLSKKGIKGIVSAVLSSIW